MKRAVRWGVVVVALGAVGIGWWHHRALLTPDALRHWIGQVGAAAPFLYVALYAANTVTLLPPIGVLSLTAGFAFGPIVGFLGIMVGAMIGTSLTFRIGRRFGRAFVERRLKGKFKSLDAALERNGFSTVLFFRVVPIVPYEVLNYASGLSKIKFKDYGLATFLGLLPGAAVAAFFGDSLTQPFSLRFVAGLAALGILIAIPIVYLQRRRRRSFLGSF